MNKTITRYLTLREAADWLRLTPYTVKQWIKSGKIKGKKIGKRGDWRIKVEEVTKILK
jgi:excisionase family DNA binding protein